MSSIFISHSSKDNEWAKSLKTKLIEQGHRSLFLDFDPENGITAGQKWEEELYTQLKGCQAVIVLCSQYSMKSPWCFAEITHARALGKKERIFPIKIDDCEVVGLLGDLQVIDYTLIGEAETYVRLWRGLKKSGLDPNDAFDWDNSRPPYPGLKSFDAKDAAIYAGRDSDILAGRDLLSQSHDGIRLILALGASGSGKSSLVKAGLLPRLKKYVDSWVVLDPFRPHKDPLRAFNGVLQACFKQHGISCEAEDWCKDCEVKLRDKTASADVQVESVVNALEELSWATGYRDAKVLITIDQVEELLGGESLDPTTKFLEFLQLLLANKDSPVMVLGTLRSDYLGVFQTHPILQNVVFKTLLVNPLGPEGIAQAIQRPADLAGVDLQPGLRELLVNDTKDGNALPLLAFTLRELWEHYRKLWERYRSDRRLFEISEYSALGGLKGAVAKRAQTILDGYVPCTDPKREAIEKTLCRAFLKLVRIDEEGKAVRRIATWQELPNEVRPLLDRFAGDAGRLLTVSGEHRQVEVSHEALFTAWPLLNKWITDSKEHLLQKQKIEAAAAEWQAEKQRKVWLLTGERLQEVQNFINSFGEEFPLNPLGEAFLLASQDANAVQEFFKLCRTIARTITVPLSQVFALVAIAKSEAKTGEVIDARDVLEQALQIVRGQGDSSERGQMLVEIAQAYRELDETDLDKLEQIVRVARGFSRTLIEIAKVAGQLQDATSAQAILEQILKAAETITDDSQRSDTLSSIADATVQLQDSTSAQAVLEQILKAAETITDETRRSNALHSIANAAGQLHATSAQTVLEQTLKAAAMITDNDQRSAVLGLIANATVHLQDVTPAQVVLEQTLKAAETITNNSNRSTVLRSISNAASQLQDATSAQAVLEQTLKAAETITNNDQRRYVLNSIADATVHLQDVTSAQAVLKQTLKAAETITDDFNRSNALSSIANATVHLQDATSAQAVLEQTLKAAETITDDSQRSDALSSIARAGHLAPVTQAVLEQILKAAETITNDYPRSNALSSIANATVHLQDATSAQAVLEQTLKAAETITDDTQRSNALSSIADATVQLQNAISAQAILKQTLKAAEMITDDFNRSTALISIANAYVQLQGATSAQAILKQTLKATETITNDYPRSNALSSIAKVAGQLQDATSAQAILEQILAAAETITDDSQRSDTLSSIADATVQLQDSTSAQAVLEQTLTAAETITYHYSQNAFSVWRSFANAAAHLHAKSAQAALEQTLKVAKTITDDSQRSTPLSSIADATVQLQDSTSAQAVLEQTLKVAKTITNDYHRNLVLSSIANAAAQMQDAKSAQAVLEQTLKAAETLTDDSKRSEALREIIKIYSSFDLFPEPINPTPIEPVAAEAVFEQALTKFAEPSESSDYRRHRGLISIVQEVDQLPNSTIAKAILDKAMNIANSFNQPEYRDKVIATISVKYGQIGAWNDALLSLHTTQDEEKTESLRQILSLWLDQHS